MQWNNKGEKSIRRVVEHHKQMLKIALTLLVRNGGCLGAL